MHNSNAWVSPRVLSVWLRARVLRCGPIAWTVPEKHLTVGSRIRIFLSNPEQITVTVDGRRMNGQQAIDFKIVAWEGTTPRVADIIERLNDPLVLARLPEAERQRAGAMVAIWRQLTPTDR